MSAQRKKRQPLPTSPDNRTDMNQEEGHMKMFLVIYCEAAGIQRIDV